MRFHSVPRALLSKSRLNRNNQSRIFSSEAFHSLRTVSLSSENESSDATLLMGAAIAAAATVAGIYQDRKTECCGIAAVVGTGNYDARSFLMEGLHKLKNRGYDGAGLLTLQGNIVHTFKYADDHQEPHSALAMLQEHSQGALGPVGMAHTRWATHGSAQSPENAHPHVSSDGKVALVHNGTLHNTAEIRAQLPKDCKQQSSTDSEVLVQWIAHHYRDTGNLKTAVERALSTCDGTWGLVVATPDSPDSVVVACNGSPLVFGSEAGVTYIASEPQALSKYTNNFAALRDGEVGVIDANGPSLQEWSGRILHVHDTAQDKSSPGEAYGTWTLQEIYQQPEAVGRALAFGARLGDQSVQLVDSMGKNQTSMLEKSRHIVFSACASSLHAAQYGTLLLRQICNLSSISVKDAAETNVHDLTAAGTACCVVSESGETKDVMDVIEVATQQDVPVLAILNAVGSRIARATPVQVYTHAGREKGVVSTKSFTAQVTALGLVALWFRQVQGVLHRSTEAADLRDALMRLPMACGAALKSHEQCKLVAKRLKSAKSCFVIGKGFAEPIAKQGALKLCELGYLHAEGCGSSALYHGCLALIEQDTPVIVILTDDDNADSTRTAAEAVKARGGSLTVITDNASLSQGLDDNPIVIPGNGPLTALGAVIPLQLIAYELGILRGVNPDTPRNLAKAVLVD